MTGFKDHFGKRALLTLLWEDNGCSEINAYKKKHSTLKETMHVWNMTVNIYISIETQTCFSVCEHLDIIV